MVGSLFFFVPLLKVTDMSTLVICGSVILSHLHPNLFSFPVLRGTFAILLAATVELENISVEFGVDKGSTSTSKAWRSEHQSTRLITAKIGKLTDPNPTTKALVEATVLAVLAAWNAANILRTTGAAVSIPPFHVGTTIASQPRRINTFVSLARPVGGAIAKYEQLWTPPRTLPIKMLLGAEGVLARLLHEASDTPLFTPIPIGARAYAASGLLNPMSLRKSDGKALGWRRTGDMAKLVATQGKCDPQSVGCH